MSLSCQIEYKFQVYPNAKLLVLVYYYSLRYRGYASVEDSLVLTNTPPYIRC